jgi:flagellar basal body rod protein FlgG
MSDGTILAAAAMAGLQRQLELTTRNLANARTPGYQPRIASSRTFDSALEGSRQGLLAVEEAVSFEPGTIVKDAGNPLAVAIDGDGFFEVQTPGGPAYTRNGDFTLDGDGRLVTRAGYAVSGEGGPIVAAPGAGSLEIDARGSVRQGGTEIGRLRTFDFDDKKGLVPMSDTLFHAKPEAQIRPLDEPRLQPEALEYAGDAPVSSLIEMIKIHRNYEAAQRAMQAIADIQQQRIRSLS